MNNPNDFMAKLNAIVDAGLKKADAKRKAKAAGKKFIDREGQAANAAARKIAADAKAAVIQLDPYLGWIEKNRILWISSQQCTCCGEQSVHVGGVFLEVENPSQRARAYIRRTPVVKLPLRVEYDPRVQLVPFCVECIETLTGEILEHDPQAEHLTRQQLTLF